ncbi:MAG TPA: hypothetical protein VGC13_18775 [Longimicrobium sp.]|jgi:hypothetical protein
MADQIVAPEIQASGNEQETRASFAAPVVQDLGKLQALTQLLQNTIILEP